MILFVENRPVGSRSLSQSVVSLRHHYVIVTMVLKFKVEGKDGVLEEGMQVHHCPPLMK